MDFRFLNAKGKQIEYYPSDKYPSDNIHLKYPSTVG